MSTVGESYFNERSKELLESLGEEGIVICRDGKPYAKVTRVADSTQETKPNDRSHLYGILKGKLVVKGDIDGPAHPWDPDKYAQR